MRTPHLILLLLILLAAFVAAYRLTPGQSEPSSMATSSPVQNPDVRLVIENFGLQLKDVSLLAPQSSVVAAMDQHYTPYVAPGLLAAWKQDPARALGRTVSSPWPERIQFAEMDVRGPKASASGTVIEVANGSGGAQIVGTYPVSFELEERGGTWLITAAERGAYSVIPARAEKVGIYTCLPHRSTTGPQIGRATAFQSPIRTAWKEPCS